MTENITINDERINERIDAWLTKVLEPRHGDQAVKSTTMTVYFDCIYNDYYDHEAIRRIFEMARSYKLRHFTDH